MKLDKYIVNINSSLIEVLKKIDELPDVQTVFVVDNSGCVVGSITDGDIRRALIRGLSPEAELNKFMNSSFCCLIEGCWSYHQLQEYRQLKLKLIPLLSKEKKLLKLFNLVSTKSILPVDAVIMAGGKGSRLRPLTDKIPKPMLPLGGKPIVEHNIDRLISYGIKNIYMSVNYLSEQIIEYFGDGSLKEVNIKYLQEDKFLGTIGSVSMISEFNNPYVLVMNSDLFTNVDFEDILLNMEEYKAELSISSIPYTVDIPYAVLSREKGYISGLKEKPRNTHYANAGIYMMKTEVAKRIPKGKFYNATDLIEDLINANVNVIDTPISGYWIDIGRHEEYDKAKEIVKHMKL